MRVITQQYDTVDALCWRYYGRTQGVTERVLEANPGLATYGAVLPHGLAVELPEFVPEPVTATLQLWD
jgi:phage tail protein X